MHRHSGCALGALLAAGLLVGCAGETMPSLQAAAAPPPRTISALPRLTIVRTAPQAAGAWYQVHFQGNKVDLDPQARMVVASVAEVVLNNAMTYAAVIGNADRVGSDSANGALSQRRAASVRDALLAAGVPSARIETRWAADGTADVAIGQQGGEPRSRVVDIAVVDE